MLCLCLSSCATRSNGYYYYQNRSFENFNILSLAQNNTSAETADVSDLTDLPAASDNSDESRADAGASQYHTATVTAPSLDIYISPTISSRIVASIDSGEVVELAYYNQNFFQIRMDGWLSGYCEASGFQSGIWDNYYGYLPEETGMAPTSTGELVPAKSHLVDVRLYTDKLEIKMKLATNGTSINEPFYTRNLCMLQYDTLQKLLKAVDLFEADGYTVVIYDAYRPTSVQQRWFDVVRVHKWVANPAIGMGGIHDRGVAVDMTLMDQNGVELDMPTAMHTFTEAASRWSTTMTAKQRENMNYMTKIMVQCGFDTINSEWWHFQDSLITQYLPTDHPIDEIPLIYAEVD